jgi:hypothetical protein
VALAVVVAVCRCSTLVVVQSPLAAAVFAAALVVVVAVVFAFHCRFGCGGGVACGAPRARFLLLRAAPRVHPDTRLHTGPLCVVQVFTVNVGCVAPTAPLHRAALVDLYLASDRWTWNDTTGWNDHESGSDPCDDSWTGVSCSPAGDSSGFSIV